MELEQKQNRKFWKQEGKEETSVTRAIYKMM